MRSNFSLLESVVMCRFAVLACTVFFAVASSCEATFTLQVTRDAILYTVVDGSAEDDDGLVNGSITVGDMSANFGGWAAGFDLSLVAESIFHWDGGLRDVPSDDGGRISVTADFDNTGAGLEIVGIAAAEVFDTLTAATVPVIGFATELSGEITAQGLPGASPTIAAASFFSTGPIPSMFDFGAYKFTQVADSSGVPIAAPGTGTFSSRVFSNPMGTHGLQLAIAQNIDLTTFTGDAGTVTLTTVVNPEPASLLLSCFGCAAFGFGYMRRRKVQEPVAEV